MKKKLFEKKTSFIFTIIVSLACVFTGAVTTFAWFQASAAAQVITDSTTAEITVSKPEGSKFYYFTGNGTPGGEYTGYSSDDSVIGKSPRALDPDDVPSIVGFDSGTYHFQEITEEGIYTAANCFNLSKIRPGCYYTFCIEYSSTTTGLKITLSDLITGANTSPKRQVNYATPYNLSLGVAINGAVSTPKAKTYAANYIQDAFGTTTEDDKIVYPSSNTLSPFTFTSGQNTTTNNFIFFSIFMGFNDKSDALTYQSKSGTGSSETILYNRGVNTGDYSPLDGLKMSITGVEILLS